MNARTPLLLLLSYVCVLLLTSAAPVSAQPRRINPFSEWAGEYTLIGELWLRTTQGLWPVGDTDGDKLNDFIIKREFDDTTFNHFQYDGYRGGELLLFKGVQDTVPNAQHGIRIGPTERNVRMDFLGAGDWDGDGHQDLAVKWMQYNDSLYGTAGGSQYTLAVFWGNPEGNYSLEDTTRLQSRGDAWLTLCEGVSDDIDRDGVDDLLVGACGTSGGTVRLIGGGKLPAPTISLFRGHPGGRWGRDGISRRADWEWWTQPAIAEGHIRKVRIGSKLIDQNCDDAPDVVIYEDRSGPDGSSISILYGTPGGGLPDTNDVETAVLAQPIPAETSQLIDITGDNVLDLILIEDLGVSQEQKVRVYVGEPGQSIREVYGDGSSPWAAFPTPIVLHDGWGGFLDRIWDLGDANDDGYRDLYFNHYPFFLSYTTGRVLDSLIDGWDRYDGLYPFDYVNVGDISGRGRDAYAVVHFRGVHFIEGGTHIDRHGVSRRLPHPPDVSRCESSVSDVNECRDVDPASTMQLRVNPNLSSSRISIE